MSEPALLPMSETALLQMSEAAFLWMSEAALHQMSGTALLQMSETALLQISGTALPQALPAVPLPKRTTAEPDTKAADMSNRGFLAPNTAQTQAYLRS
jgi:hypothetical protein